MATQLLSARVHLMRHEADGVVGIELRPVDPVAEFPPVEAGAHVDVHLPNGIVRSYSLSNMPGETHRYVLGVLLDRASRGGSRFVHEQLRVGSVIGLSGPRNHFQLNELAEMSVLVAGGIGITPLLSMLRRLSALGQKVHMIYCARSRLQAGFMEDVRSLTDVTGALTLHFDDEQRGPPDLKALMTPFVGPSTHFYACGPSPMLAAYESTLAELGQGNVHLERFTAIPSAALDPGLNDTNEYQVELHRSRRIVTVKAGQTLLDAMLDAGIPVNYSCCEGVCGTCETPVLSGEVEHRDGLLSDSEKAANRTMMVCVSRPMATGLVLDI
ncbi:PDR/VanB family oxidoreductase [Variovorax sp. VNK109]|uniref:PDR/VanB family oxidoreductase n=1 Tax=Variovorax sp. VNK109 TaxID=3400919 RepID=UPI003C00BA39